jgi:hypothetical protein
MPPGRRVILGTTYAITIAFQAYSKKELDAKKAIHPPWPRIKGIVKNPFIFGYPTGLPDGSCRSDQKSQLG